MGAATGKVSRLGPVFVIKAIQSPARVSALKAAGQEHAKPQMLRALVDTGASLSAVDPTVVSALNLEARGRTRVHTPSSGSRCDEKSLYDVTFVLGEPGGQSFVTTVLAFECELISQGFSAILGCDVLLQTLFVLNGPKGEFSIEWGVSEIETTHD